MSFKDKIIAVLKTIGIAILGFITIFIFEKLFARSEDKQRKQEEEIKDALDTTKEKLEEIKQTITEQDAVIDDIKSHIKENEEIKDEIVHASEKIRIEEAYNAGFKKG
jgi:uncharacterized membrane-anchored protein YhcB (DUF1043 family)